jgi:hypothetical protein
VVAVVAGVVLALVLFSVRLRTGVRLTDGVASRFLIDLDVVGVIFRMIELSDPTRSSRSLILLLDDDFFGVAGIKSSFFTPITV